jgi:hypothetical protein
MSCSLFYTYKGTIRSEPYNTLDLVVAAYNHNKDRYAPAWAYDAQGQLILGTEPNGFPRPRATG